MNRIVANKGLLLIVILSLSIMPMLGNGQDKGTEQIIGSALAVNYSQDEEDTANAALDKGDPQYPKNIEGLGKEELIKRGFGTVNPSYPKNIEGLSKEELIKRGFDKDDNIQKEKDSRDKDSTGSITGVDTCNIGPAVENTIVSWISGNPDTGCEWYRQTTVYYYGGDAARSKHITDNHIASMQTQVAGPGTVSFFWSIGSEYNYDFLKFYIDGVLKDRISGSRPWELKSYYVTGSGTHTFRWNYRKDGSVSIPPDAGYVDKFVWTGNVLLADALDIPLVWSTYGNAKWFGQTRSSYNGAAAQSGSIGDNQRTILYTEIYGPGKLSFWWRVMSEQGYDFLEFYIDNQRKDYRSGNPGWQYMTYSLGPGNHILYWIYRKDGSVSIPPDVGWVDVVHISST